MIAQLSSKATISLSFCMNAYEVKNHQQSAMFIYLSPETQVRPRWRSVGTCQVLRLGRTCTQQNGALGKPVPSGVSGGCVRSNPAAPGVWTNATHNGGISSSGPNGMCACLPQDRLSLSARRSNGYERSGSVQLCRTCCSSVQQAQSWTLTPEVHDVALNVTAPIPVAGKDGALTIRRRTCLWLRIV